MLTTLASKRKRSLQETFDVSCRHKSNANHAIRARAKPPARSNIYARAPFGSCMSTTTSTLQSFVLHLLLFKREDSSRFKFQIDFMCSQVGSLSEVSSCVLN